MAAASHPVPVPRRTAVKRTFAEVNASNSALTPVGTVPRGPAFPIEVTRHPRLPRATTNTRSCFDRFSRRTSFRRAAVLLVALAWSSLALAGEIQDAAQVGDLGKVKALLKADPALAVSKDQDGLTPLHWAALQGHKDVAELLLTNKADINARDKLGTTPLHAATIAGQKDVAELLLANHADVNARDNDRRTPLHYAAANCQTAVAKLLLAAEADVNAKDKNGLTPLHWAAFKNCKAVVELLLANKAEVNAKDNMGWTPIHRAIVLEFKDVVELLRQHGGKE